MDDGTASDGDGGNRCVEVHQGRQGAGMTHEEEYGKYRNDVMKDCFDMYDCIVDAINHSDLDMRWDGMRKRMEALVAQVICKPKRECLVWEDLGKVGTYGHINYWQSDELVIQSGADGSFDLRGVSAFPTLEAAQAVAELIHQTEVRL